MKLNRNQLDAQIMEIIKTMSPMEAKEILMNKFKKNSFSRLTLEEMETFIALFALPQTSPVTHFQSGQSHPQK